MSIKTIELERKLEFLSSSVIKIANMSIIYLVNKCA